MRARLTLSRFFAEERGTVVILLGLMIIPLFGIVGAAVDVAWALHVKARLQAGADAAVIAGTSLPQDASDEARIAKASAVFNANTSEAGLAVAPQITTRNDGVSLSAVYEYDTAFLGLLGFNEFEVSVESEAKPARPGGYACLLALNPTTSDGIHIQGKNQIADQNCWAWANSTNATAINASGTSVATGAGFCTPGGVSGASHFTPEPFTGPEECERIPDPFTNLKKPTITGCDYSNVNLASGERTFTPGTYCGGIEVKPQARAFFEPGLYVIKDGELKVQAGSHAEGENVTFYFTGHDTKLTLLGGGTVSLKGATAGDYAGFLFIQDGTSNPGASTVIQGGGSMNMEGILYMPTWLVEVGGNGDINQNTKMWAMIADSFYMTGNGKLFVKADYGAIGMPDILWRVPTQVRLTK